MAKLKEILHDGARYAIFQGNRLAGRYDPVIWVVGHRRSGTTWLAELLNHRRGMREIFEPFHPQFTAELEEQPYHFYLVPGKEYRGLRAFADRVFCGQYTCTRVDESNTRYTYRGLLIKDIFANLFLKWATGTYPGIKKIWIVRHPCAVAVSKLRYYQYHWMKEPKEFLEQTVLMREHLEPFRELIETVETDFEKTILIWCVAHYVPFRQLERGDVVQLFYEDLVLQPEVELRRIFRHLHGSDAVPDDLVRAANKSSRTGTRRENEAQLNVWRDKLDARQMARAVEILTAFGLNELYDDATMPKHAYAAHVREAV